MLVQDVLRKLTAGENLTAEEAYNLIVAIKNDQLSSVQIAGFQVALLMKGPTLEEITAIAKAMRDNCETISPQVDSELLDTCGTGGGLSTFNISTAVAIVAAAAGIPVAKHGSRSISSLSGSADVLEALGVEINLLPRDVEKLIEEIGIAFIYAPLFHPVMHKVLTPEQELGIKTIFYTIIGPLINPARATRHILGVYKAELLDIVAQIALSLGYTRGNVCARCGWHGRNISAGQNTGKRNTQGLNHQLRNCSGRFWILPLFHRGYLHWNTGDECRRNP
jgi:anthranilate phosphoribosyltransferase